jgi:hypothetical protein
VAKIPICSIVAQYMYLDKSSDDIRVIYEYYDPPALGIIDQKFQIFFYLKFLEKFLNDEYKPGDGFGIL